MWLVIAGLVGMMMSLLGVWLFYRTKLFLARAIPAEGQYVDATWTTSMPSQQQSQVGTIAFQTADGQAIQFNGRLATPFESQKVGRTVRVLYDPANPEDALIDSFIEIWMPSVIFGGVGAGWLLATLIVLWL
ncbi:MAG: DUF3592 domain-containing protein [Ardenticatenales bacterium]|nr:DUF3592 domain-containing protein [Ardenticatenales bacterium]